MGSSVRFSEGSEVNNHHEWLRRNRTWRNIPLTHSYWGKPVQCSAVQYVSEGGRDSSADSLLPDSLSTSAVLSEISPSYKVILENFTLKTCIDLTGWLAGWLAAGQATASQDPINCISTFVKRLVFCQSPDTMLSLYFLDHEKLKWVEQRIFSFYLHRILCEVNLEHLILFTVNKLTRIVCNLSTILLTEIFFNEIHHACRSQWLHSISILNISAESSLDIA